VLGVYWYKSELRRVSFYLQLCLSNPGDSETIFNWQNSTKRQIASDCGGSFCTRIPDATLLGDLTKILLRKFASLTDFVAPYKKARVMAIKKAERRHSMLSIS